MSNYCRLCNSKMPWGRAGAEQLCPDCKRHTAYHEEAVNKLTEDKGEKCSTCHGTGEIATNGSLVSFGRCLACNGSGVKDVITDTDGIMKVVEAPKPKYGTSIITKEILKEIDKDNLRMNNELDKKLPKRKTLESILYPEYLSKELSNEAAQELRTYIKEIAEGMEKHADSFVKDGRGWLMAMSYNQALSDLIDRI